MPTTLIHGATLVTVTDLLKVDVLIHDGVIAKLAFHDQPDYAAPSMPDVPIDEVMDAEGLLLMPSLIDCHVHFREPGLEHKGTMRSEAAAAKAGGIGTVCEMPNTNPPTVTIAALADKVRRSAEIDDCDIRFFFGVTEEAHLLALRELWTGESAELKRLKNRCCGVKLYLDHSTGNQKVGSDILEEVLRTAAELKIPVVAHCEDSQMNAEAAATNTRTDISAHSLMRPPESEAKAVEHAITLATRYGTPLHVAHISTWQGIDLVRSAKAAGLPVTCEVTPHHLLLSTDAYGHLGALAKVNPPLRSKEHVSALWAALTDGTIDCVSTDHAPHTLEEKNNPEPLQVPSGMPGVETMLPILLTVADGRLPFPRLHYEDIIRLCFENPNTIFGLGREGVKEGAPADLILIDPKKEWTIRGEHLHSLCKWTPFEGMKVRGTVVRVLQ